MPVSGSKFFEIRQDLKSLRSRLTSLGEQNRQLHERVEHLQHEKRELEQQLERSQQQQQDLEKKHLHLQLAKGVASDGQSRAQVRRQIESYIRKIDNCIEALKAEAGVADE